MDGDTSSEGAQSRPREESDLEKETLVLGTPEQEELTP